jgi:plastocyanin domain-containing protein
MMQQNAMQQSQMNGQVQMQSAQATEQMKQQTEAMKHEFDMEYLKMEIEGNLAVQELKNKTTETAAALGVSAKIITDAMSSDGDTAAQSGQMPQPTQQPQPTMAQ